MCHEYHPKVSSKDIRARVSERSFQHGQQYYRGGAIFHARQQGMRLKARCERSRAEAYRVQVIFDGDSIAEGDCSCPVGSGGACKHVAARLLTWRAGPEESTEVEELAAAKR